MINKLAAFYAARGTDAYLVGGFVRDWLISAEPGRDIDIAVPGDPGIIAQAIAQKFGGVVVPLSPAHGVVRVVVPNGTDKDDVPWNIDVDGFSGTIEEDLARRH